jgi:hypothetical protein
MGKETCISNATRLGDGCLGFGVPAAQIGLERNKVSQCLPAIAKSLPGSAD